MEPGTLAKVLRDFLTTVEGELSLNRGEFFLVHDVLDKYWCYGVSNNREGNFPTSHLHEIDVPKIEDGESLFISIAPFRGEQAEDLSFNKGELIVGNREATAGWFTGRIDERRGTFPVSYVWQIEIEMLKKQMRKKSIRRKAKIKASLQAQLDEELNLNEGEIVTVTEVLEDGWCRGINEHGQEGIFPEGFISYIEEETTTDEVDRVHANSDTIPTTSDPIPASAAMGGRIYKDFGENLHSYSASEMDAPAPSYYDLYPELANSEPSSNRSSTHHADDFDVKPYAVTLYKFNSQFPNELNFEDGQVVELIKHVDSEWLEGIIDGVKGIFPASYVDIVVDVETPSSTSSNAQNDSHKDDSQSTIELKPDTRVRVDFTFAAQMDGDLNITEGETVTIVEMTNSDWVTIKNSKGETGLCPRSYLNPELATEAETFYDAQEDFVELRHDSKKTEAEDEILEKRFSEPHRPAPPAPSPGRTPLQKQSAPVESTEMQNDTTHSSKQKQADQRQNIISELFTTEKDFIRDLKITYETFNLHNHNFLTSRGIDVATLFGNIEEITQVAEDLLESIQWAMKNCDEGVQTVGPCFLELSERMKKAYGVYCNNYQASLDLLAQYKANENITTLFDKGVETIRLHQVECFDMNSILIKPVQRILKYPLMLNDLKKCTPEDHPDKPKIEEAYRVMSDVACYINEYKRKKDLASKYLQSDNTLMRKMARLNMHSVAKKSSRFTAMVSATLGLTNLPVDENFDALEKEFLSLDKCAKQLVKDVEACIGDLNQETICGEVLAEQLNQYFQGMPVERVQRFRDIRADIRSQYLNALIRTIERRVTDPLLSLITLLEGPALLITKRHDKMRDYDTAISKKDKGIMAEELAIAKNNYEALNQQLLEELPVLIEISTGILYNCIGAFTNARKLLNGRIMNRYLQLTESMKLQTTEEILESFAVNHSLLYNQIARISFSGPDFGINEGVPKYCAQSEDQRTALKSKYPRNVLYVVTENTVGSKDLDIAIASGTLVGVIKTQDPMGNSSRWFVDSGSMKGFVPKQSVRPLEVSPAGNSVSPAGNSVSPSTNSSQISTDLIVLDSPEKKVKWSSSDLESLLCDTPEVKTPIRNYSNAEPGAERVEFIYVLNDFDGSVMPGGLSARKGQALKVIKRHELNNNPDYWLVETRNGSQGYVPRKFLGSANQV